MISLRTFARWLDVLTGSKLSITSDMVFKDQHIPLLPDKNFRVAELTDHLR